MKNYLLDAFPVLAWLQDEPGHHFVDELLTRAEKGEISLSMQMINLGEVYYRICRITRLRKAEETISKIRMLPISIISVSDSLVMDAAKIKGKHPISYADAFAVATALHIGATVVTGDPEYKAVSKLVQILWIPGESS
jgi:ribonuclease VapC